MGLKELKDLFKGGYNYDDPIDEADEQDYEEQNVAPVSENKAGASYGRPAIGIASRSSSIEMKVVTPSKFEMVSQIADLLLEGKTVLLNLEKTNKETAKRLIDFLSGVAYALSGDVQKVADNTYAITPSNVAVSSESAIEASASAGEDYAAEENLF